MVTPPSSTEAGRYIRHELLEAPQRAVAEADAAVAKAHAATRAAEQQHQAARHNLNTLFQQAVQGEDVPLQAAAAASTAVSDASSYVQFRHQVAIERKRLLVEARQRLVVAEAGQWRAVLDGGIDRRIDAAHAADLVLLAYATESNASPQEVAAAEARIRSALAEARAMFLSGTDLMLEAFRHDVRPPNGGVPTEFPVTESSERKRWRRPREEPTSAAA